MLVWSALMLAAGVCANPSATSRAGPAINKNALFMESSKESRLAAVRNFAWDLILLPDSGVEPSRRSGSGVRTWSIQVKPHNFIGQESDCLLQTAHI
jgi:hypothetical protein